MKNLKRLLCFVLCLSLVLGTGLFIPDNARAAQYTLDATLLSQDMPGVYTAKAALGADANTSTLGISSISKQTLASHPTTESPAIITGAATGYEIKTGPTEFEPIPGAELKAPYSYFRWNIIDETIQNPDGTTSIHKKLTGFDGTYYIIRVDVSDIIDSYDQSATSTKVLHVKQSGNTALMVASGMNGTTFADALGNKTGSYPIKDNAAALKDASGAYSTTPYIDVIVMSDGLLAGGAATGGEGEPNGDFSLTFYVDDVVDYNPSLVYDPNSTDPNHVAECLKKFYSDTPSGQITGYTVKGSDLDIDVEVDDAGLVGDKPQFWSINNAMAYQEYDSHVIKLICEAPVLEGISVASYDGRQRNVILDVNSFDIQIANDVNTGSAGLPVRIIS